MKKYFVIAVLLIGLFSSCDDYETVPSVRKGDQGEFKIKIAIPLSRKDTTHQIFDWKGELSVTVDEKFWFGKDTVNDEKWLYLELPEDTIGGKGKNLLITLGTVEEIRKIVMPGS